MSDLDKLLEKEKQLKAKIQAIKLKEKQKERKLDTRRKILIGAMVLEGMRNSESYENNIKSNLDKYLTKDKDRNLFNLAPIEEQNQTD